MTAPPDSQEVSPQPTSTRGLAIAVAVAGFGAVLVGLAPLVGVVTPRTEPAFTSWPYLLVLAALPPVLALLLWQRPKMAAAVLLGPAAVAVGRLVADAQLIGDAGMVARPELLQPVSIGQLTPAPGLWMLLAGHLATAVAGVLAMRRREQSAEPTFGESAPGVRRRGLLITAVLVALVVGIGLLMVPFGSDDPFLLPRAALDASPLSGLGQLTIGLAVLAVAGYAAVAWEPEIARGAFLGLSLAVVSVVGPSLLASVLVAELHPMWTTGAALLAALAFALLAIPAGRSTDTQSDSTAPELPTMDRMLLIAGGLALASGGLALLGAGTARLDLPGGFSDPSAYPARMLWPAGVLLLVLGAAMVSPLARRIRPALTVGWVAMPMAATSVLGAVLTTTAAVDATTGIGTWAVIAAVVLAPLAGIAAALGGGIERDDVDLTELRPNWNLGVPAALSVLLALGAFGLPVVESDNYTPPGLITEFDTASWGLVAGLLAVGIAAVLVPRSRPERAAALLGGASTLPLVRLLEFPLTEGRAANAQPGLGLWFAGACVLALVICSVLAARTPEQAR